MRAHSAQHSLSLIFGPHASSLPLLPGLDDFGHRTLPLRRLVAVALVTPPVTPVVWAHPSDRITPGLWLGPGTIPHRLAAGTGVRCARYTQVQLLGVRDLNVSAGLPISP